MLLVSNISSLKLAQIYLYASNHGWRGHALLSLTWVFGSKQENSCFVGRFWAAGPKWTSVSPTAPKGKGPLLWCGHFYHRIYLTKRAMTPAVLINFSYSRITTELHTKGRCYTLKAAIPSLIFFFLRAQLQLPPIPLLKLECWGLQSLQPLDPSQNWASAKPVSFTAPLSGCPTSGISSLWVTAMGSDHSRGPDKTSCLAQPHRHSSKGEELQHVPRTCWKWMGETPSSSSIGFWQVRCFYNHLLEACAMTESSEELGRKLQSICTSVKSRCHLWKVRCEWAVEEGHKHYQHPQVLTSKGSVYTV